MRTGDEYQEYSEPQFAKPSRKSHKWQVLAQKYGIERYRCKCGCIKTVTKGSEKLPVTRYELKGERFLNAPGCLQSANNCGKA
jgi:hypothetical protein